MLERTKKKMIFRKLQAKDLTDNTSKLNLNNLRQTIEKGTEWSAQAATALILYVSFC